VTGETLGDVLRRIGRLAGLQGVLSLTDAQLLERFAVGRDEPAFAALMVRHGPMVLGVCRRLLRDADQAEDAFQASFLVLARKAGTIKSRPLLSAWLYGVAYKVAARLRGRAWRRQARETQGTDLASVAAAIDPDPSDLPPLLHEEVQRLPDKYRNPIVLCYLEGKTHEEAALLLRWPLGTVKTRLTRARGMLRSRLTRRGVTASEGMMTTALAANPATAPAKLVDATIRAATRFAAGENGVDKLASARAIALSQGVLRTMILTKVKIVGALVLTVTMLGGGGAGWLAFRAPAAEPDGVRPRLAKAADKPADKGKDDKEAIQGTWQLSGVERGGKEAPDNDNDEAKKIKSTKWVVTADKITFAMPGQEDQNASYKLDPTKKPKEIDLTPLDGPANEKGKTGRAIYSLDGDVLKICMPGSLASERPTELATREGGKTSLFIFKRVTANKDKPKEDKPGADKQAIQGVWQVTDVETNDKKTPGLAGTLPKIKTQQWTFTADKVTPWMPGEKDIPAVPYTLDPSKKPKEIDITPEKGNDLQSGVYSLEGDVLKLCFARPHGGPRPTELAADEAGKNILLTFKRVTADKEKPKEDKPKDDAKVKKLLQDMVQAAKEEFKLRKDAYFIGNIITAELVAGAARRVLTAELEQSEKKEDRVKACEEYLERITEVARRAMAGYKAGQATQADAVQAEYYRLEAEILLAREKSK
jgi:RNA polymerase sigma factor (sigma-70 family)